MLSQTVLLALASTAAAALSPGHMAARRALEARQTSGDDLAQATKCLSILNPMLTTMPKTPPEIVSFAMTQTETDVCSISIPASLSSAYKSYEGAYSSWVQANSARLQSALSQCPDYSSMYDELNAPSCTDGANSGSGSSGGSKTAGAAGAEETGSGSDDEGDDDDSGSAAGSNNNGNDNTTPGKNAGHRETGFAGAAIALAGFIGVVAAL